MISVDVRALLLIGAALAAALGIGALVVVWWTWQSTGFHPDLSGRIVASDTSSIPPILLSDPELGLRGRPDYLVHEQPGAAGRLVPIEVKPSRRSARLYESDAVQLGAYLLASRAMFGDRSANFGFVRYASQSFRVELTGALETQVREIVAAVRWGRSAAVIRRSHATKGRCRGCALRRHCDDALS